MGIWDDIIDPITNAIWQFFSPYVNWVLNLIYNVLSFVVGVINLLASISNILIGLFGDVFTSNPYAATTFGLILTGISIVVFMRIYNIVSDIEIFGWKLPRL